MVGTGHRKADGDAGIGFQLNRKTHWKTGSKVEDVTMFEPG